MAGQTFLRDGKWLTIAEIKEYNKKLNKKSSKEEASKEEAKPKKLKK